MWEIEYSIKNKIPKVVYQTCWTKRFDFILEKEMNSIRENNKDWSFILYNDDEMDEFVKTEYDGDIYKTFKSMKMMVAKADFWRYLVLYKKGGLYLDIDSDIVGSLSEWIRDDDSGIAAVEPNGERYVQWALIFAKGHPILKKAIEMILDNFRVNRYPNDIMNMTGPDMYGRAIKAVLNDMGLLSTYPTHQYFIDMNEWETPEGSSIKFRILGMDYKKNLEYHINGYETLYKDRKHWSKMKQDLL